jgi:hypothetical protein
MRPARQGKLDVKPLVAVCFTLAFFGFLFYASIPHVHRPDRKAEQRAQLKALDAAVELFANEFDGYPPSDANDSTGQLYCGSMKLVEAVVGRDLLGFHTQSIFRRDGLDAERMQLYPPNIDAMPAALRADNLKARKGPFLPTENISTRRLVDIYGRGNTGSFAEDTFVLCDAYTQVRPSGEKTGMPILYYRANPSRTAHDARNPDNLENIYCCKDNQALLALGVPGKPGEAHPLADPKRFYLNTEDLETSGRPSPYRRDTFILISAGQDGLYGTADDICNFQWKYRKR